MIVKIEKNGYEVKVNGVLGHINRQSSKGPNHEIVEIDKIVGPEFQQSISLSLLQDGVYDYELKPRKDSTGQKTKTLYTTTKNYTQEQLKRLEELKNEISEIENNVEVVKIPNVNLTLDEIEKLCKIENISLLDFIKDLQEYTTKR